MRPSRSQLNPGMSLALAALAAASACSATSVDGKQPASEPVRPLNAAPGVDRIAGNYEASIASLVERIAQDQRIGRDAVEAVLGVKLDAKPVANGRPQEWALHGLFSQKDGFRIELHPAEAGLELAISNPLDDGKACYLHAARIRSLLVETLGYKATELGAGKRPYTLLTQNAPPMSSPVAVALFSRKPSFASNASPDCVYSLELTAAGG